jgi:hypothetical protein
MIEDSTKINTLLILSTDFNSVWQMICNLHHDTVPI